MNLKQEKTTFEHANEIPAEGTRMYELRSGVNVEVGWKRFDSPKNGEKEHGIEAEKTAIIFLPGWKMSEESKSINALCEAYASNVTDGAYAMTTRTEERGTPHEPEEVLHEEARAIGRFMHENGIKNVTIAGHSQGGDKAVNLVSILQQDPSATINGIILISPVGMYEQPGGELTRAFFSDIAVNTPAHIAKNLPNSLGKIPKALRAGNDVTKKVAGEVWRSGLSFPARLSSEIEEMGRRNSHLHEIKVPVILITGTEDAIAESERIVPPEQEKRVREQMGEVSLDEATTEHSATDKTLAAREQLLKENMFPDSPYVRMLIPEKSGVHSLPFLRPETVAKTSLYMLERYHRTLKK